MKFQMRQTNSNTCNVHGAVIQVCQAPKGPVKKSDFGLDCREGFLWNVIGMFKGNVKSEGMGPAARCWRTAFAVSTRVLRGRLRRRKTNPGFVSLMSDVTLM